MSASHLSSGSPLDYPFSGWRSHVFLPSFGTISSPWHIAQLDAHEAVTPTTSLQPVTNSPSCPLGQAEPGKGQPSTVMRSVTRLILARCGMETAWNESLASLNETIELASPTSFWSFYHRGTICFWCIFELDNRIRETLLPYGIYTKLSGELVGEDLGHA